jgi:hypothetical protein
MASMASTTRDSKTDLTMSFSSEETEMVIRYFDLILLLYHLPFARSTELYYTKYREYVFFPLNP